jgi:hypothetical protein
VLGEFRVADQLVDRFGCEQLLSQRLGSFAIPSSPTATFVAICRKVPQGRLRVAQDVSPGLGSKSVTSPEGTTENFPGRKSWVNLALYSKIPVGKSLPSTAYWVIFSRPYGTNHAFRPNPGLTPDFLHAALERPAYAAFFTESRTRLIDSTKLHRNPGPSWATLSRPSGTFMILLGIGSCQAKLLSACFDLLSASWLFSCWNLGARYARPWVQLSCAPCA